MWQETLHEYLLDPAFGIPAPRFTIDSPRLANCIVSELLSTEETYLNHLSMLKQAFIDPFSQRFQNRYMIRDLQTIFSHIPQLISLSTTLVHRWRMILERQTYCMNDMTKENVNKDQNIGRTFCDVEDEFQVYVYYAVHYAKAKKCITRMEQKPSYRQWMHSVLQNEELHRMELADYLISPIQRITRYCLLLKDLSKHTDGYHMELERTLKFHTALAVAMNNCQK
ncbi:Dbl homology domain-containing protein [Absidia repens]|uniref:Dbl homology domain-containing protein n=1 Tax=Absidia repens TaxID=90262 RepID=A0A1X2IYY2_9FUNG|nr:Dbl homology domain-containing protein [Absidia repens]